MIRVGEPPYLECSSRGDKRFSAFYARVQRYGGRSIEDLYQASKVFEDGATGLSWKQAKGRRAVNQERCARYYTHLWATYICEHPELWPILRAASGLSDMFGQAGHCCQAVELWRIRAALLEQPT
ncbi:hypothetical protein [Burkholderia cenocepacia]|uniref:hypothetical protein n=1 Tax=Burkholderia cenocepacia TaxID=95486 RepID=UPI0026517D19|nr:hypothetical protein [Burkholderia cenocepacia]MDN7537017.1 hypothetical protein [Burkholderia cenocepacia]